MFGPTWQGKIEREEGRGCRSVNERPVVTLWEAGGHIGEQQVLNQSGRWSGPPKMATSKEGEPLIGC